MVMNEMFDEWKQGKTANGYGQYFDEWSERDVTAFVRRESEPPFRPLWSAGNETGEQASANGVEMVRRLVGLSSIERTPHGRSTMGSTGIAANLTGVRSARRRSLAVLRGGYNTRPTGQAGGDILQ